jgi:hypothetical protein
MIKARYPSAPVLWSNQETPIILHIHNPGPKYFCGILKVNAPSDVNCLISKTEISLPAGDEIAIELGITSKVECEYINDKNLFTAKLISEDGSIACEHIFGLEAARLWQVYGPYWDMWDKEKYAVCPYQNDEIKCNPACIPGQLNYFNHHVRFAYPYLDEVRLLHEDIPEELPFNVEVGGDKLDRRNICNFIGAACYYLVRIVKSDEAVQDVICNVNRSVPCKVWFDGKVVEECDQYTCWAPEFDDRNMVNLTGKPQRLIIKIAANTDDFTVSNSFVKIDPTKKHAVSPFINNIAYLKNGKDRNCFNNRNIDKKSRYKNKFINTAKFYPKEKTIKMS